MPRNTLLQSTDVVLLALVPTTVDRVVVWGALVLVIALIAWRECTLPDVPLPAPDSERPSDPHPALELGALKLAPRVAPPAALAEVAEPRPVT